MRRLRRNSFSTQLLIGLVVLVLATTLSAGVPAYWITRLQMGRKTWSQVENLRQATDTLIEAEAERLGNLAELLAARPTLAGLAAQGRSAELILYLDAFRQQSGLDMALFCAAGSRSPIARDPDEGICIEASRSGFHAAETPLLLSSRAVKPQGVVVVGRRVDAQWMKRLAEITGVEQSLLGADGALLSSSLSGVAGDAFAGQAGSLGQEVLWLAGRPYYALETVLDVLPGEPPLRSVVALPVDDLNATNRRALTILGASTSLVALLAAALGVWYVRRLAAPLGRLTAAAEAISAGELLTLLPAAEGPHEVRTLAAALGRSQASMLTALAEQSSMRKWLDQLVQSIEEGVVTLDSRGYITFLSRGAETLTGAAAGEVLGRSIDCLATPADPAEGPLSAQIPAPGQTRQVEVIGRGGHPAVLAISSAPLPAAGGGAQTALVLRDVTEAEAWHRLRSYFLANISHEFRTPLSTLRASLELLMEQADDLSPAEMRELLGPSTLSLLGLQTLIDNLLESSSIEAGRFVLRKGPVQINAVVADALQVVQPLLERRRQPVSLSEPAEPPTLNVDRARITQVLINLITNAAKYSPIGAGIDLIVSVRPGRVRISVADRGPGVSPDDRAGLFRRFVRLERSNDGGGGMGIGLYVVRTAVEAHGGQVGIDDRPGGGSIFWFELPIEEGHDETADRRGRPRPIGRPGLHPAPRRLRHHHRL